MDIPLRNITPDFDMEREDNRVEKTTKEKTRALAIDNNSIKNPRSCVRPVATTLCLDHLISFPGERDELGTWFQQSACWYEGQLFISFHHIVKKGPWFVCHTLCTIFRCLFQPRFVVINEQTAPGAVVRGTSCSKRQHLTKQKYQWKSNWKRNTSTVSLLPDKVPVIVLLTVKDMCKWFNICEQKYSE